MNLSGLDRLGRVAGLGGIAVGATVLLLDRTAGLVTDLPSEHQTDLAMLIAGLGFAIGVVGLMTWLIGKSIDRRVASARGEDAPAMLVGGDVDLRYDVSGPELSAPKKKSRRPQNSLPIGTARTEGNRAPAIITSGNASVQYGESNSDRSPQEE